MPANNSLSIIYAPVGPSLGGIQAYHETLEYTNGSGQTFYSTAGPTSAPTGNSIFASAEAAASASSGKTSSDPYGAMFCVSNLTAAQMTADGFASEIASNLDTVTISTNFSAAQWTQAQNACTAINSAQLPYSPLTLNSNSAASTEIKATGITPPTPGLFDKDWAPASDNILKTPETSASDGTTNTISTTNGITTDTIAEVGDKGATDTTNITLTTNATGTADSAKLGHDGTTEDTETDTWTNATNYTDKSSGTNVADNNGVFTQTVTDSNGNVTLTDTGTGAESDLTGATLDFANNTAAINFGNNDNSYGGTGDKIDLAGSGDKVTATNTTVDFLGTNLTGDSAAGSGDTTQYDVAAFGYGGGYVGGSYGGYSGGSGIGGSGLGGYSGGGGGGNYGGS